MLLLSHKEG